jgi:hypothetical protein
MEIIGHAPTIRRPGASEEPPSAAPGVANRPAQTVQGMTRR